MQYLLLIYNDEQAWASLTDEQRNPLIRDYFALTDELETARQWVQTVIERDRDNKFAREILSAMDY